MLESYGDGAGRPSPRSFALVGPQGSGKSTLFEALLAASDSAPSRRGGAPRGTMGTELRLAHAGLLGDPWAILDCPGSVEFSHDAGCALAVVDLAVVVCEPAPERAANLGPLFRRLEETGTPALVFVNKLDALTGAVRDTLAALQAQTRRKLVLRQVPIREGEKVTGYVDVVSGRAYRYRRGAPSERIACPRRMRAREARRAARCWKRWPTTTTRCWRRCWRTRPSSRPRSTPVAQRRGERRRGQRAARRRGAQQRRPAAVEGAAARRAQAARPPPAGASRRTAAARAGVPDAARRPRRAAVRSSRLWRGPLREGAALDGQRTGGLTASRREAQKVPQGRVGRTGCPGAAGRRQDRRHPRRRPALPFPEAAAARPRAGHRAGGPQGRGALSPRLQRLAEEDPALP
jgi:elongation factor G